MDRIRSRAAEHPGTLLAGAAMVVSFAVLLRFQSRLTFWRDEWDFLLHRRDWTLDTFFDPFVEHLVAASILIYKVGVEAFGMDSAKPFQVIAISLFVLSVGLLFVYARRRAGEWVALAMILPILFLGPSWDDLLFPFQMALFGSMACGIGALLALERRDRAGDILATCLLLLGLLFSDLGVPFVAAATFQLALTPERFTRAWVVAAPTSLWLLWYLVWGHDAQTFISFRNFANSPEHILDGLAASIASWVGLGAGFQTSPLDWGRPLLILALGLLAWRLYVLRRITPRLLGTAVALLGFWFLTALNTNPLAPPTAGRYQYIGIVLLALVVAELVEGMRIRRYALVLLVLAGATAAMVNGSRLRDAANGLYDIAHKQRGGLAALELARDRVDPAFELDEQNSGVDYLSVLDAGSYLSAIDDHGSPAYTPEQLDNAPESARVAADKVSAAALGARLEVNGALGSGRCLEIDSEQASTVLDVPGGGVVLRAERGGTQAWLRRWASESFPVELGALEPRVPVLLRIPPDRSLRPWVLELTGDGPVTACRP